MAKAARAGDPPETAKITVLIKRDEHPELAAFLHAMPWGWANPWVREVLEHALQTGLVPDTANGGAYPGLGPPRPARPLAPRAPSVPASAPRLDPDFAASIAALDRQLA